MNPYGMDKISGLKAPRYRIKPLRFDEFLAVYRAYYEYKNNPISFPFAGDVGWKDKIVDVVFTRAYAQQAYAQVNFSNLITPIPLFIFNEYFEKVED